MNRVRRQAARWVARRLGPSDDADPAFEAWREADPTHASAFDSLWLTSQDPALTEALTPRASPSAARRRRNPVLAGTVGLAAMAALALAVAWPDLQILTVPSITLETAAGAPRAVALADGTRVVLDGATRLDVRLGAGRRQARLVRGEAFLDVAHDPRRPFSVTAPEGSARVLGTAFDVERTGGRLVLSVHRGRVRLAAPGFGGPSIELTAGQGAAAGDDGLLPVRRFDPAAADWRSGWLETDGVTLDRLVERLNRRAARAIVLEDEGLAQQQVAGRFRLDDADELVRNLALVHGFEVRESANTVRLTR